MQKRVAEPPKGRTKVRELPKGRTAPFNIKKVAGYPDRLEIFQIAASKYWQVRLRSGKQYKRKSTGQTDEREATKFAKQFYDSASNLESQDKTLFPTSFGTIAHEYLEDLKHLTGRERVNPRKILEEKKKLEKDIIPYFGEMEINDIRPKHLVDYLKKVLYGRDLSDSTIQKHFITIRNVMKFAVTNEHLKFIPQFPKTKLEQKPRAHFNDDEYKLLWATAVKWGNQRRTAQFLNKKTGKSIRILYFTREFSDFIVFSSNVFVRLSDVKILKHKHVKIIQDGPHRALEISPSDSKTVTRVSLSMPRAVLVYERLVKRHAKEGKGNKPDDYIFYPEYQNRKYALGVIWRMFNHLLHETGLKTDAFDHARSLYSLRHTALMFRFLYMDPPDIFLIAQNALTSVAMLEKFYLSHADTRAKLAQLQSTRKL